MSFTKFTPPPRRVLAEQMTERIQRTQKLCLDQYQTWVPNRTIDRSEIEISLMKQKYPDNYSEELKTLARVKLPRPNMFVINKDNEKQTEFGVSEVFVFNCLCTVWHPSNPETEQLCHAEIRSGWMQAPKCIIQKDELGNIVSSRVISWENLFWIPFEKSIVKKVLSDHNNEYKNLVIVTASTAGLESYYESKPMTIYSLDEWLDTDFSVLEGANQGGFLRKDGQQGGAVIFQKEQDQKRKRLEQEVSEYSKKK